MGALMLDSIDANPTTPEAFSRRYDSSIVVRRWGATWLDLIVLALLFVAPLALPERVQLPVYVFAAVIGVAYFPVFEHIYGRTLGKLVCRVRVVNAAGERPSWGQAGIRTLLRLIEVNPALLGGVPAGVAVLSSKKRQRIGDMAADTFVLREEDYRYLTQLHTRGYSELKNAVTLPLPPPLPASSSADKWLIPTNRSGWCIAAGYLGLFAVLVLPAPVALAAGIIGLRDVRRHPGLGGRGRAWFGIVMGTLFSLLLLAGIVSAIVGSR
jgi:uncharacterized RDD family membrane protein YckC